MLFWMHPMTPLALITRAHCGFMGTSCPPGPLTRRSVPSQYWCMWLFLNRCRPWHFLLSFVSQSRFLRMAVLTICQISPLSSIADLLVVLSASLSRSLQMLNRTGPSIDPMDTPWLPTRVYVAYRHILSLGIMATSTPPHCLFIQAVLHSYD